MKKSDVTYFTGSAFVAFMAIAYCLIPHLKVPLPRYFPLENVWRMTSQGGPSQGWYGLQLYAFTAGGLAALAVYVLLKSLCGKKENEISSAKFTLVGILTVLIIGVAMSYILCHEFTEWGVFEKLGM